MIKYPLGAIRTLEEIEELVRLSEHKPIRVYFTYVWDNARIRPIYIRPGCLLQGNNMLTGCRGTKAPEVIHLDYLNIPVGKTVRLTPDFMFTNYFLAHAWVHQWKAGLGSPQRKFMTEDMKFDLGETS